MSGSSTAHIVQSLAVNLVIACSKGVAAVITGSGALLAETIHSFADCGNQILLLLGVRQARRPPSAKHPLGYGRALYFYSFMVAMLLFSGGGVFSVYEGVHKVRHREPVGDLLVGFVVLGISLALEGWATIGNIKELNARRGKVSFVRYLAETKDSDLVVVFGENSAAVLGLILALGAMALTRVTGDPTWDGVGSLGVGVVLIGVALFLAREIKSLLVGERAEPIVEDTVREVAAADPNILEVLRVLTVQQGPGEVVVAMKLRFKPGLTTGGPLCTVINEFEQRLHDRLPEIKWSFVEPDLVD